MRSPSYLLTPKGGWFGQGDGPVTDDGNQNENDGGSTAKDRENESAGEGLLPGGQPVMKRTAESVAGGAPGTCGSVSIAQVHTGACPCEHLVRPGAGGEPLRC